MDAVFSPPKRCMLSTSLRFFFCPTVAAPLSSHCITYLTFLACQVVFQTKVYHPGINEEGSICIPILRDEVGPRISLDLDNVIALWREIVDELFLFHLLCDPIACHQWKPSITLSTSKPSLFDPSSGHKQDVSQYSRSFKRS